MDLYPNLEQLKTTPGQKKIWLQLAVLAKALAIFGFVSMGALILGMMYIVYLFFNSTSPYLWAMDMGTGPNQVLIFLTLTPVLIAFTGIIAVFFYIFREHLLFANQITRSIKNNDQGDFESSWMHLRNHFRTYGILVLICVALTIVGFFLIGFFERPPYSGY